LKTSFCASSLSVCSRAKSYGQAVISVKEYTLSTCELHLELKVLSSLLKRKWLTGSDKEKCLRKRLFRTRDIATPFVLDKGCTSELLVAFTILERSLLGRVEGSTRVPIARISQCHCEKVIPSSCVLPASSLAVSEVVSRSERHFLSNATAFRKFVSTTTFPF